MSWHKAMAAAALLLLGACAQQAGTQGAAPAGGFQPRQLEIANLSQGYNRTFEQSFTEAPFAKGAMSVVATENGELQTYDLVPCQGGAAICAGSLTGPAVRLVRTPDWSVVQGLYGRTFWLSHGGDGYLERNGQLVPLTWEAQITGTGDGSLPSLETPYRHG
ncbi:hypothetical protein [Rubellimicrobium arenae]|uniref:hypothetical protein n=1 Tax=Rubellimicrobium arenae TaxID=2817372 RepID=UPI001B308922|nr:hypothetical protein [Rubellimicrobium arenae]